MEHEDERCRFKPGGEAQLIETTLPHLSIKILSFQANKLLDLRIRFLFTIKFVGLTCLCS
jgi:hypothetical protein